MRRNIGNKLYRGRVYGGYHFARRSDENGGKYMNIIGVDDQKAVVITLEKMLKKIGPDGQHRFYTDPIKAFNDLEKPVEVAFLDIEMPDMDGLELAKRIIDRYPLCNIIFLTGHSEYSIPAFDLNASGYILKPFSQNKLRNALEHRRYRAPELSDKPVKVQCFGTFEVFVNNKQVQFSRSKSKELLAYLIDRGGAMCDMDMIIGNIEPGSATDRLTKNKIRVYIGDLKNTFDALGIHDIIIRETGSVGVNKSLLDCDYYRLLNNDPFAISLYTGEYMTQYEFAEETREWLNVKYSKDRGIYN